MLCKILTKMAFVNIVTNSMFVYDISQNLRSMLSNNGTMGMIESVFIYLISI